MCDIKNKSTYDSRRYHIRPDTSPTATVSEKHKGHEIQVDNCSYRIIFKYMNISAAFFHVIPAEDGSGQIQAAIIKDFNDEYARSAEKAGLDPSDILNRSYLDLVPEHDPKWHHYFYESAISRKYVHGSFRNREFGSWVAVTAGPAHEAGLCWMTFFDFTKYQNENDYLYELSFTDRMTDVNNRNKFESKVAELKNKNIPVGVIIVDINALKQLNDTHGHKSGDTYIERTVDFLKSISDKDHLYRTGGDEFVFLLEGITCEETKKIALKIKSVQHLSLSCGASWTSDSSDIQGSLNSADLEMYEEKKKYYASHDRRHV